MNILSRVDISMGSNMTKIRIVITDKNIMRKIFV